MNFLHRPRLFQQGDDNLQQEIRVRYITNMKSVKILSGNIPTNLEQVLCAF